MGEKERRRELEAATATHQASQNSSANLVIGGRLSVEILPYHSSSAVLLPHFPDSCMPLWRVFAEVEKKETRRVLERHCASLLITVFDETPSLLLPSASLLVTVAAERPDVRALLARSLQHNRAARGTRSLVQRCRCFVIAHPSTYIPIPCSALLIEHRRSPCIPVRSSLPAGSMRQVQSDRDLQHQPWMEKRGSLAVTVRYPC